MTWPISSNASGFSSDDRSPGSLPRARARTARRTIFADRVFGNADTQRMRSGLNALPSSAVTASDTVESFCSSPGFGTQKIHATSPFTGCGTPTAAAAVKGEVAWIFCVPKPGEEQKDSTVSDAVTAVLGKAFKPDRILWVSALTKTRSAKIVRRAVRARALGKDPGDLSSLENPEALEEIGHVI